LLRYLSFDETCTGYHLVQLILPQHSFLTNAYSLALAMFCAGLFEVLDHQIPILLLLYCIADQFRMPTPILSSHMLDVH
jgi:hypothetical protein